MAPPLHEIIQSPDRFAQLVDTFLSECAAEGVAPYLVRFCMKHNVNQEQLSRWQHDYEEATEHDPQCHICQAIKRMKDAGEMHQLDKLERSKSDPNAMFLLKANHGYVETANVKHEHSGGLEVVIQSMIPKPDA